MLNVGDYFPQFQLTGVLNTDQETGFQNFDNKSFGEKWVVYFFWPKDFTFVCPTEIQAFGELNDDFLKVQAKIVGISTDSEFVHFAWRKTDKRIANIPFPLLSDVKRDLTISLGVLDRESGVAQRATFIVDPEGIIRFTMVTDMNIGRNPQEVLRVLKALRTGHLISAVDKSGTSHKID